MVPFLSTINDETLYQPKEGSPAAENQHPPSDQLKVEIERVFANSVEDGVHATVNALSARDFVHLGDHVDISTVEDNLAGSSSLRELGFLLGGSGSDDVGTEVLTAEGW